jgi:hypothetical protein
MACDLSYSTDENYGKLLDFNEEDDRAIGQFVDKSRPALLFGREASVFLHFNQFA